MTCRHHWRIQAHSGQPDSPGSCLHCGERRLFSNVLEAKYAFSFRPSECGLDTSLSIHADLWRKFYRRVEDEP